MKDLTARLSALDPEAGAALRAVTYFDALAAAPAGLPAVLRGAAALTGAPAGITDPLHRVSMRVDEQGRTCELTSPADTRWPTEPAGGPDGILWVERFPIRTIDAVVVERAAALATDIILRTHPPAQKQVDDDHWARLLVDAAMPEKTRQEAAHKLRLAPASSTRAIALPQGHVRITDGKARLPDTPTTVRAGIGPAVPALQLPYSWAQAQLAFRLTAEGTSEDPGPRVVYGEDMGTLALLAEYVGPDTMMTPDEEALDDAALISPRMLLTLDVVAYAPSTRAAAVELRIHHSTLQERILRAEKVLGWQITETRGRLRLQLVLALRRLRRSHRNSIPIS